jgi:hypothetical protein
MPERRYRMVQREGAEAITPPVVLLDFFDATAARHIAVAAVQPASRKRVAMLADDASDSPGSAAAAAPAAPVSPLSPDNRSAASSDADDARRRVLFIEPEMLGRLTHLHTVAVAILLLLDIALLLVLGDAIYTGSTSAGAAFTVIYAFVALAAFAAAAFLRFTEIQSVAMVLLCLNAPIALFAMDPDDLVVLRIVVVAAEVVVLHTIRRGRRLTWIGLVTPEPTTNNNNNGSNAAAAATT